MYVKAVVNGKVYDIIYLIDSYYDNFQQNLIFLFFQLFHSEISTIERHHKTNLNPNPL